jgi:putative transposase
MKYNPSIHHRRSIRLKSHDYAGGGEYFVTVCAHREFIAAAGGMPFHGANGATCASPVREILLEEWAKCGEVRSGVHPGECVVMPDHFHGLIRIAPGASELGRVIGAFKAAASRRIRGNLREGNLRIARTGDSLSAPEMRIWHRNYYEKIVRSEKERAAIAKYIALNPARLVFRLEGMAAFGNPNLWEYKKIGVLASGSGALTAIPRPKPGWAWLSGFHSGLEQAVLKAAEAPAIRVAAVEPQRIGLTNDELTRLDDGRLLVLCPFEEECTTRENALKRNRLVAERCDKLWIPATRKGGSLEKLKMEYKDKVT